MMGVYLAITLLGLILSTFIAKHVGGIIRTLLGEVDGLVRAAHGRLSLRAEVGNAHPEFRPIVEGFNQVLDAVVVPLGVAADYVDRISRGEVRPKSPTTTAVSSMPSRTPQHLHRRRECAGD